MPTDLGVVLGGYGRPSSMAHSSGLLGRRDDVGEKDGGRDYVALNWLMTSGEELLDLIDKTIDVTYEEQGVFAGQLDILRTRDMHPEELPSLDSDGRVALAM